ncbi:MAG: DUF192 domain-containing protein [Acidobacteria bacterium]|nr:DUF192 domain-containing protein [Acidobacteriota bacterium]
MRVLFIAALCLALAACSSSSDPVRDFNAREVTLPDGAVITVEVMTHPTDMSRGMMFRDSLAPNRGMLFIHGSANRYPYWMYQVKIPLDMIWMDPNRRVVEISANTPPCESKSATACPNYGGHEPAQYVLEINGGHAAKHGVQVGSYLSF